MYGYFNYKDELYHHGILGMQWGDRNGPPYPLSGGDHSSSEKKAGWRKSLSSSGESTKVKKSNNNVKVSKSNKKSKSIFDKFDDERIKGYQNKYNVSLSDAKKINEKYKKLAKGVLIGVGAVSAAALGYYAYTRYGASFIDRTIKAGVEIQNIGDPKIIAEGERFYGTFKNLDKNKYIGLLGRETRALQNGAKVGELNYKNVVKAKDAIKVASNHSAQKIYNDLLKNDPNFSSNVKKVFGSNVDYKDFNRQALLYSPDSNIKELQGAFFNALKGKGYGAVNDVNDQLNSGFNAKAPTVFFDKSKLEGTVSSVLLNNQEVDKAYKREMIDQGMMAASNPNMLAYSSMIALGVGVAGAEKKAVNSVKKEKEQKNE